MRPTILLGKPIPFSYIFTLLQSVIVTPKVVGAICFITAYYFAIGYTRRHSYRDPSSVFFDDVHGYDKIYSLQREKQAAAFIQLANEEKVAHTTSTAPKLCVGVATVSRPAEQYIRSTIGSILEGLTETERQEIHLVLFIAHTNPALHPIFSNTWVKTLPDTLLTYDKLGANETAQITTWEEEGDYRSKGLYDYSYLLQSCYETGAPFAAILEGDVLAVDGWYPRAMAAAEYVDGLHFKTEGKTAWLYIRMFYTEAYLGWNSEELNGYLIRSFFLCLGSAILIIAARSYSHRLQKSISNITVALIACVYLPACIALYFAAGRNTMQPPSPGVREMSNFGCCSQGFIFARETIPFVRDMIEHHSMDYIDMLMEAVAAGEGMKKYAIFPSLLQHIGGKSSKGDVIADARARMIWNFGFEMYNAASLRLGRNV